MNKQFIVRVKLLSLFLFITFSIISCSHQNTSHPIWVRELLDKPVCLAPCWENITPGVTTQDELSQILNQGQGAFDIRASVGSFPWGDTLSWCEGGTGCGSSGDISVFSAFDNKGIVQEVYLYPSIVLYLKDFVPLYGYPEKVGFPEPASSDSNAIVVDLLYPRIGLNLEFLSEDKGSFINPSVEIRKNLEIVHVFYTVPGLNYYYLHNVSVNPFQQFEWKGYTHYP